MQNLIKIETVETKEVSIVTQYRVDEKLRRFICAMANSHLSELDCNEADFTSIYKSIRKIYNTFNRFSLIELSDVKNVIRLLDRRIAHCKNLLTEGEWVEEVFPHQHCWSDILKTSTVIKTKRDTTVIVTAIYNQSTMDTMVFVRQMLSDMIILITSEFE